MPESSTDEGFTYWNTGIGPNDEAFSIYAAVENSEALTAEDRAFIEAEGLTIVEKSELEALSADLRYVAVENSEALTAEDRAFIEAEGLTIVEKPELEALSPEEQWNIQGEGLVYWNWVRPHYEYVVVSHLEELSAANRVSIEAEGLTILEESELEALSPEERAAIEAKGITGVWSPPSTYLVVEDLDWADEEGRRSLERHGYVIFERAELAALPEEERAAIEAEGLTPLERLMCVRPQGASKN